MDDTEHRRATILGKSLVERGPVAESARYDAGARQIVVRLRSGLELRVAPEDVEGLRGASDEGLASVAVEPPGLQLRWEGLDVSLFLPYLVEEKLGDDRWVRLIHGQSGGRFASSFRDAALWRSGRLGRLRKKRPARAVAS